MPNQTLMLESAHRMLRRQIILAIVATAAVFGLIAPSAGAARRFPVPNCGWVPDSLIWNTFHAAVRAQAPVWSTHIAPVLTCGFAEPQPMYAPSNVPLVTIQFRELQTYKPPANWTFVRGLGSCVEGSSCPAPHRAAYIRMVKVQEGGQPSPFAGSSPPPPMTSYVAGVGLKVEDGLNTITVLVQNPYGALPVKNEVATVEKLARKLLPRFYWR